MHSIDKNRRYFKRTLVFRFFNWKGGKMYELHQGDCLEIMKDIPIGLVDMILYDLPYARRNVNGILLFF